MTGVQTCALPIYDILSLLFPSHDRSGLYIHQVKLLAEANLNNDTAKLDEVINVAKELLQAWKEETEYVMD